MKTPFLSLSLSVLLTGSLFAADTSRKANLTILDATGVQNLRIQTVTVEAGDFEETIFALGRIEAKPGHTAAVSSRISGRVTALTALPGDKVAANAEVLKVESRQPGNPAPVIALVAPLGGTVTRVDVRLGDPVEPDRALLEITDLSEVIAVARVPENSAGRIKPGATAHIRLSAFPDRTVEGRLQRFGTAADAAGGTLDAVFVLANPDGLIRPGMRAEFSVVIEKRAEVMSIPRAALQGEPAGRFVFVKDFDLPNAFLKTPVVTGQVNDRSVEIVRGLLPADEVVVQGAYSLAFAGGGSLSLKEALDAAHGHEHNADGSELTAEQKKKTAATGAPAGHDHSHEAQNPFWMIVSGVLFVALVFVGIRKTPRAAGAAPRQEN
jgi:cobalt-zinc-cadmium efflux system membrane fusion protein